MNKSALIPSLLSLMLVVGGCTATPAAPAATAPPAATTQPAATATATRPAATPAPTAAAQLNAEGLANQIKQGTSTKVVVITEDNDPNDLIGRPNGYTDAAVIYDQGAKCTSLGTDCGATIEIWPSQADAQKGTAARVGDI